MTANTTMLTTIPTVDLTRPPADWPKRPSDEGLRYAKAWAVEQGYIPQFVPITKGTVRAANEAGIDAWFVVHLLDRATAIKVGLGYEYARFVDQAPHRDTREAAIREGVGYFYARYVDRCPRADTRAAAIENGWGRKYAEHFPGDSD